MSRGFGIEAHRPHANAEHREVARYLVIIEAGGSAVARLYVADRTQVAEFDAGTEEVALMTRGREAVRGASGAEWDRALDGHSAAERAEADVYTLDV